MAWQNVSFLTDAASAEPLCDALIELGALSASIEDADAGTADEQPQFGEPGTPTTPGWQRSRVLALCESDTNVSELLQAACQQLGVPPIRDFSVTALAEQNWVQLTQAQFDPIQISGRLWIVPSWHESPDPSAINLVLDPGMAFGTGSHPTTRLCLEWLEKTVTPGCSVFDYGCGSGILAIAAGKLGAREVRGLDIDPQAVEAARANAERNAVMADFVDGSQPIDGMYDVVVANILSNPLRVLAPAICALVRPAGGQLALSGILREQADEIIAVYAPWIALTVADVGEDWVCLSGRKI
ncbi:50S ribosomal protein L11 methyltransferase [Azonexus hydrophilus]|uniref:50S ribosomal protein L11 methyltransferase n=1 Tax=Azonexus hydrophilus TaxID=418702 RepID=UPI00196682B5|nr:50S ribosomal protein L11 methyltransferase [Azonexus hydrophilus]